MFFKSRSQAAELLAEQLLKYKGQRALLLGIPRGAVPMAKIIADAIDGELDVVLVRKLTSPNNPELAIGAINESGNYRLTDRLAAMGISEEYINFEKQKQLKLIHQRRSQYTPVRSPVDPTNRLVIIVDNGVATGFTMKAALQTIRQQNPAKLIAAMAVAPPKVVEEISELADEVICLQSPEVFLAVGRFYEDFHQVSDQEVIEVLQRSNA